MKLSWAGGYCDVLLDLVSGRLLSYADRNTATDVHQAYGGRLYYLSRSGLSGSGWVPDHPELMQCDVYRVDIHTPAAPEMMTARHDVHIIVPVNRGGYAYRAWPPDYSWPVIVLLPGDDRPLLLWGEDIPDYLHDRDDLVEREEVFYYYRGPKLSALDSLGVKYRVPRDARPRRVRSALRALYWHQLRARPDPELVEPHQFEAKFWSRLGLLRLGDVLYRIRHGIADASYEWRGDLRLLCDAVAECEQIPYPLSRSVHVTGPTEFLARDGAACYGYYLLDEERRYALRVSVPIAQAIGILRGDESAIAAVREAAAANLAHVQPCGESV